MTNIRGKTTNVHYLEHFIYADALVPGDVTWLESY